MGEIDPGIGNGLPNQHCGLKASHPMHANDGTYCDGVPPLGPFLELVVRVPLVDELAMTGADHQEALQCILDEGLQTFAFDELTNPRTSVALRLRWCGEDRVYPLVPDGDYSLKVRE